MSGEAIPCFTADIYAAVFGLDASAGKNFCGLHEIAYAKLAGGPTS